MRFKLMKKIILGLSCFLVTLNSLAGGGPPAAQKGGNACVSDNFCTYSEMPLQNQGALTLKWYINKKEKNWNLSDPGWCGAVAGMMAIYGMVKHNRKVKYNSWLDDKPDNHYGAWKTGVDFKTDFKKGGTYDGEASAAVQSLLNRATNYKSKYYSQGASGFDNSASIKNEIKAQKHVEYLSICKYGVENKRVITADLNQNLKDRKAKVGYYEVLGKTNGCHALALNGYDGNKLIINDPWGRVYTVDFESIFYGSTGGNIYAYPRTRVTYNKWMHRTWDNFSHFMGHGGEKGEHTILTGRIKFAIYQP
jgi:hypothetical protein